MNKGEYDTKEELQFFLFLFLCLLTIASLIGTFFMMSEISNAANNTGDMAVLYVWAAISISCLFLITYITSNGIK